VSFFLALSANHVRRTNVNPRLPTCAKHYANLISSDCAMVGALSARGPKATRSDVGLISPY
jgi:hypothetical protein